MQSYASVLLLKLSSDYYADTAIEFAKDYGYR